MSASPLDALDAAVDGVLSAARDVLLDLQAQATALRYTFDVTSFSQSLGSELLTPLTWVNPTTLHTPWHQSVGSGSSLNEETANVQNDTSAVKLTIAPTNALTQITQSIPCAVNDILEVSGWILNTQAGKTCRLDANPPNNAEAVTVPQGTYERYKTLHKPNTAPATFRFQNAVGGGSVYYGDGFSVKVVHLNPVQDTTMLSPDVRVEFTPSSSPCAGMRLLIGARMPSGETNPLNNGLVALLRRNDSNTGWEVHLQAYTAGLMTSLQNVPVTGTGTPTALRLCIDEATDSLRMFTSLTGIDGVWTQQGVAVINPTFHANTHSVVVSDSELPVSRFRAELYVPGVLTDADALQQLISAGGTVTLTRNYALERFQEITLPSVPLHLIGAGFSLTKHGITDADHTYQPGMAILHGVNATDLEIEGVTFQGWHISGWANASAGTAIYLEGANTARINLHGNAFLDLVGFPLEALTGGNGLTVDQCSITNCGNGINVNMDNATITNNPHARSEGIEAVGNHMVIRGNSGTDMVAGWISIGGDIGHTTYQDILVEDNPVNGIPTGKPAIIVADGVEQVTVQNNPIQNASIGIEVLVAVNPSDTISILNNPIDHCGTAIYLPFNGDLATNITLSGNTTTNISSFGLQCGNPHATIVSNDFRGGAKEDVALSTSATGCVFDKVSNLYSTLQDQRTA